MPGAPYFEAFSRCPAAASARSLNTAKPGRATSPEPVAWRGFWQAPNGRRYRIEACEGHRPTPIEGSLPST
jgi:hypothetical protein